MKKKPHQKKPVIQQVFSDFRENLHLPKSPVNGVHYEVKKNKNGYEVLIHKDRGANETLRFDDKNSLDEFLKSLN